MVSSEVRENSFDELDLAGPVDSTVMVVDDDPDVRAVFSAILQDEGYDVLEARDGSHALDLLTAMDRPPQLVLMDLMMPRMSGWDLLAILRADDNLRDVPVAVMTAVPEQCPDDVRCVEKPCDSRDLLQLVRGAH